MDIKEFIKKSFISNIKDYNNELEYKSLLNNCIKQGIISSYLISTKLDFNNIINIESVKFRSREDILYTINIDKRDFKLKKIKYIIDEK